LLLLRYPGYPGYPGCCRRRFGTPFPSQTVYVPAGVRRYRRTGLLLTPPGTAPRTPIARMRQYKTATRAENSGKW